MFNFITDNLGTIFAGVVIFTIVVAIIIQIVRDKKKGRCTSCDCCPGNCHSSSGCYTSQGSNTK